MNVQLNLRRHYLLCRIARKEMEHMLELRHELGDIQRALEDLHMNPNKTTIG